MLILMVMMMTPTTRLPKRIITVDTCCSNRNRDNPCLGRPRLRPTLVIQRWQRQQQPFVMLTVLLGGEMLSISFEVVCDMWSVGLPQC
jgi:hypothetical protein